MNKVDSLCVVGEGTETLVRTFGFILSDFGDGHIGFADWGQMVAGGQDHVLYFNAHEHRDNRFPSPVRSAETMAAFVEGWLNEKIKPGLSPRYKDEDQPIDGDAVKGWKLTYDWRGVSISPAWIYYGK